MNDRNKITGTNIIWGLGGRDFSFLVWHCQETKNFLGVRKITRCFMFIYFELFLLLCFLLKRFFSVTSCCWNLFWLRAMATLSLSWYSARLDYFVFWKRSAFHKSAVVKKLSHTKRSVTCSILIGFSASKYANYTYRR